MKKYMLLIRKTWESYRGKSLWTRLFMTIVMCFVVLTIKDAIEAQRL